MKQVLIVVMLMFCAIHANSQLKITYGINVGVSRNYKNTYKETYTPQFFNAKNIYNTKGYTSPVVGLHAILKYKFLYSCINLEYNRFGSYSYRFEERGFYYMVNNERTVIRYFSSDINSQQYSKLNLPLELGICLLNKRKFKPIVYGGINLSYLISGRITDSKYSQDPFTRDVKSEHKFIEVLNPNDNMQLYSRRFRKQALIGVGLEYKNTVTLKASVRGKIFYMVNEKRALDNNWDNCLIDNIYDYSGREYLLTFQYHF